MDFRNTKDPEIFADYITFEFMGEIFQHERCSDFSPPDISAQRVEHLGKSQLVVSNVAATCFAEALTKSKLGKFNLNKRSLNAMLGTDGDLDFDTTSMGLLLPILKEKTGLGRPLNFEISWRDMKIDFHHNLIGGGNDVSFEFIMKLVIKYDTDDEMFGELGLKQTELLYDELKMFSAFTVTSANDMIYPVIKTVKLNVENKYGQKDMPNRNKLDLTPGEYKHFLAQLSGWIQFLHNYLNDTFLREGIEFPYFK